MLSLTPFLFPSSTDLLLEKITCSGQTRKTGNEIVILYYLIVGSFASQKYTSRNNTLFFTTLSPTLITITLTHNAALLSGLCLSTSHVLLMSLNLYELFDPKLLLIAGRCYS
jgi:hypothetical protein